MSVLVGLIPIAVVLAIVICVLSLFTGGGDDGIGIGYSVRRYWWVLLFCFPAVLILFYGIDWVTIISFLIVATIAGSIFLFWMESGFELPKEDPVKMLKRWLKENFRW